MAEAGARGCTTFAFSASSGEVRCCQSGPATYEVIADYDTYAANTLDIQDANRRDATTGGGSLPGACGQGSVCPAEYVPLKDLNWDASSSSSSSGSVWGAGFAGEFEGGAI